MSSSVRLGGFQLTGRLRRGGMAEVWRGVHPEEQAEVAVKLVDVERAQTRRLREALQNEVRAMARLEHPNVVRVHDYGEVSSAAAAASGGEIAPGTPYLVMELAEGGPLARAHVRDWPALKRVLRSILEALAHAHARGVVHRDLKPSNVLVSGERFLLSDFGISSALTYGPTGHAVVPIPAGTAWFMAPEQVLGLHRDEGPWTDLYSLGCLGYLLTTGHPPFPGNDRDRIYTAQCLEPPPRLAPDYAVPAELEAWLGVLLAKRPRDRFPFAADALRALEALDGEMLAPTLSVPSEISTQRTSTNPEPLELTDATVSADLAGSDTKKDATEAGALIALAGFGSSGALDPEMRARAQEMRAAVAPSFGAAEPPAPPPHLRGIGLGVYGLRAIPLAGRTRERRRLWEALEDVWRTGRPRVLELRGRAGHGKTRLAEWLAERAHADGAATVGWAGFGPAPSPDEGLPRMWRRLLRGEGLSRSDLRERLEHHPTRRALDELGEGDRAALLDLLAPDALARPSREQERFAALLPLLTALSQSRPVLLVFDDVPSGREAIRFAEHLLGLLTLRLPVLAVLTAREEALADRPLEAGMLDTLRELPRAERITLAALDEAEHAQLIGSMLGLQAGLAAKVAAMTDGNPLFAIQLVGDWVQRGALQLGQEGFRLPDGASPDLPDDIHGLWTERVERLLASVPDDAREAASVSLELAALLGRRVAIAELRAAVEASGASLAEGLLDELASRRLARVGRAHLSFEHGLLTDSLIRRAREAGRLAALHRACATALEESPDAAERVGRHLVHAGDALEAAPHLLAATASRLQRCDYPEARALATLLDEQLAPTLPETDVRRARAAALQAEASIKQGDVEGCLAHADRAAATDDPAVLAEVSRLRARAALKQGEMERAAERFEEALERMRAIGDRPGEGAALHGLGEAERVIGRIDSAVARFESAIALFEELEHELDAARARIGLGDTLRRRGELERAVALIERALEATRRLGNPHGVAVCANTLGDVARGQGRLDEAEGYYQECLRELEALASRESMIPRINLGFVRVARRRWAAARDTLEPVREALASTPGFLVYVESALLACDAGEQRWDALEPRITKVAALLEELSVVDEDLAWCLRQTWREAGVAGEQDRAQRARALAAKQYRELGQADAARELEGDVSDT